MGSNFWGRLREHLSCITENTEPLPENGNILQENKEIYQSGKKILKRASIQTDVEKSDYYKFRNKVTELIFRHSLYVHSTTVVLLLMLLNWPDRRLYDSNVATICWNLLTVEVFMIIPAIILSLCSFLFQLYTIQISLYRSVCFLLYPKNGIHTC